MCDLLMKPGGTIHGELGHSLVFRQSFAALLAAVSQCSWATFQNERVGPLRQTRTQDQKGYTKWDWRRTIFSAVVVSVLKYMVITVSNHCYQCTDNRLEGYFHPAHWQPATFQ